MSTPVLTLVVNPSSGRGRAGLVLPRVEAQLRRVRPDADLRVERTTSYQHARTLCAQAVAASGPDDALLVMGGDGMAHLGANACATTDVPLGVLPAGTGNDFCRGMGLPHDLPDAVQSLAARTVRRVDLARLSGGLPDGSAACYVGSVVSTGYDARVNRHANQMPASMGSLAYAWAALRELAVFRPLDYRLELDGVRRELRAMFVAVGNAGVFGGGMHVCPDAVVDDGWLDVTIVHPVGRGVLLALLPVMFNGAFVRHPAIEQLRVRRATIDGPGLFAMADGEELGGVPVQLECVPQALSLLG